MDSAFQDAQKLAVASDLGKLSLALRKTGAAELTPVAPMRTGNFLVGGRSGPARPGAARPSAFGPQLIMIIEGGAHGKSGRAQRPAPAAPAAPAPTPPAPANFALVPISASDTPAGK